MNLLIRRATVNDIDACANLLYVLFNQDLEFTPNRNLQVAGLSQIIENPIIGQIFVAEIDSKVIAMVSLLFGISTVLGGKVATLEDMIVEEPFRKQGIGKRLFQTAMDYSREVGCLRVTLLTDHDNSAAISFYESLEFSKSPMIPLRRLL